jgi:hypothetical protein
MSELNGKIFVSVILDPQVKFIARLGGSDYDICANHINDPSRLINNEKYYATKYEVATNFNGYYDKAIDKETRRNNFITYVETMIRCYKNAEAYTIAGYDSTVHPAIPLGNVINSKKYGGQSKLFKELDIDNKFNISYLIIESMMFLPLFDDFAKGKKILFISPFSESIKYQYERKEKLFKNYVYPEFELMTYSTPVTYNNSYDNIDSYNVEENWLAQCHKMACEIALLDFDIAFLSCGSYAMFLGDHIAHTMGKKAIYLGGVLNMYFNIYGSRFIDRPDKYFEAIVDMDHQITALEANQFDNIKGGRVAKGDSLLAYL